MRTSTTLVIIPTYNEIVSAPLLISKIVRILPNLHVLVVDDGSPDGTAAAVEELAGGALKGQIHLLQRGEKSGLGAAYRAGFVWAIERGYKTLIEMDADGSHRPEDLDELIRVFESDSQLDLVIGSRWVTGGTVMNWPRHREILSRSANMYAKILLHMEINDVTAGFRIYKSSMLQQIDFSTILSQGYCFQIEMTQKILELGGRVKEVPITFIEREYGVSKMNLRIVIEAMLRVTIWGIKLLK